MEQQTNPEENKHTYDNGFHPKEVNLKETYTFYHHGFFFRLLNIATILITQFFFLFAKTLVWGYRVKGRKNLKKTKGAVLICNHTHPLDALIILTSCFPKRIYVTTLQSNLGFGIVSKYFRAGGAVPIPEDKKLFKRFNRQTVEELKKGYTILVYPEAALVPFCNQVRPFMPGAFHFAQQAQTTIIPSVMTYHKPKGLYRLTRRKRPCIHYNILPPYTIKDMGNKKLTLDTATEELHTIMAEYFNKNSDYFQ